MRLAVLFVVLGLASACQAQTPVASPRLTVGLDLYGGISSKAGLRRFSDQLWAANQIYTPSVATLNWASGQGTEARVAIGLGEASRGDAALYKQPVELWGRQKLGGGSLQVGRFFTPFGLQEWQYEAREGIQWESARGALGVTASLQKDPVTRRGNGYLRLLTTSKSEATQLGVSLAGGKGFSYGTALEQGIGLDATLHRGAWLLRSELDRFVGPQRQGFRFALASATYEGLTSGVQPFVSYYDWQDRTQAQELGTFHTLIGGATLPVSKGLTAELAGAQEGKRFQTWLQFHFVWEH